MDVRAEVADFPGAESVDELEGAWCWSPVPGLVFVGALSSDGERLLQMNSRDSFDRDLAVAALRFAREHEVEIRDRNPLFGAAGGFRAPDDHPFDAVAMCGTAVHNFYKIENPALNPLVRVVFPAYSCEFSGDEDAEEALTRYKMLSPAKLDRSAVPFLRMKFSNTRTKGRSTNPGRGFTEERRLLVELREMHGAPGSFVEFENRLGKVWHVEWGGAWLLSQGEGNSGERREVALDDLMRFAADRLRD